MATLVTRIDMRVNEQTKQLAERAATLSGCTVTEYLTRLILKDAPKVLQGETQISLSNAQFDHFMEACKSTKAPSKKLLDAAKNLDNNGFKV